MSNKTTPLERELRALLVRTTAALENPGDLSPEARLHVIEDASSVLARLEEEEEECDLVTEHEEDDGE